MLKWTRATTPTGRPRIKNGLPVFIPTLVCNICKKEYRASDYYQKQYEYIDTLMWSGTCFREGARQEDRPVSIAIPAKGYERLYIDLCPSPCAQVFQDQVMSLGAVSEPRYSRDYVHVNKLGPPEPDDDGEQ